MNNDKMKGIVKFFNSNEGFGFIWPESELKKPQTLSKDQGGRQELFFHLSNVNRDEQGNVVTLHGGDEIDFEVSEGQKGPHAIEINRVKRVAEKNRIPSLVVSNVTVGIRKKDIPHLISVFKDLSEPNNAHNFQEEQEAISHFLRTLENAEGWKNYGSSPAPALTPTVVHEKTSPVVETVSANSKKKKDKQNTIDNSAPASR